MAKFGAISGDSARPWQTGLMFFIRDTVHGIEKERDVPEATIPEVRA
jgi:hypothetical protein